MKKTIILAIVSLGAVLITAQSCKHDSFVNNPNDPNNPSNPGVPGDPSGICFERDILPIFISNCAMSGCHDPATAEEGYVLNSYAAITSKKFKAGEPDDCEIYEVIIENEMPPYPNPKLTSEQIAMIKAWIESGAPNTTDCGDDCDTTNVTFAGTIQPLVNNYCKGCHNAASAGGGYNFESYSGVNSAVVANRLLGAIRHESGYQAMPQGGSKLSDCQIREVEIWIENGALNN